MEKEGEKRTIDVYYKHVNIYITSKSFKLYIYKNKYNIYSTPLSTHTYTFIYIPNNNNNNGK